MTAVGTGRDREQRTSPVQNSTHDITRFLAQLAELFL